MNDTRQEPPRKFAKEGREHKELRDEQKYGAETTSINPAAATIDRALRNQQFSISPCEMSLAVAPLMKNLGSSNN